MTNTRPVILLNTNYGSIDNYTDAQLYTLLDNILGITDASTSTSTLSRPVLEKKMISIIKTIDNIIKTTTNKDEKNKRIAQQEFFLDVYDHFKNQWNTQNPVKDIPLDTVYNKITDYTDNDLYTLLNNTLGITDASTLSNKDLEIKIISIIDKLNTYINSAGITETDKTLRLAQQDFFLDVYDRFKNKLNETSITDLEEYKFTPPTNTLSTSYNTPNSQKDNNSPVLVNSLDYKLGVINPIQKQTIKRIISIDSQQRNTDFYRMTTEFTYDLSETLKDVLALRLYYYYIPGTWYTVANTYGSNFIFLKGNAPGIDIGNYDMSFQINPGNYTASDIIKNINENILNRIPMYTDISLGNTKLSYNGNTRKCTFQLDIKLLLNEVNYRLEFKAQNFSYPENETTRFNSINSFLGYNFQSYQIGDVYSQFTVPNFSETDTGNTIYKLTNQNNHIYIIQTTHQEYVAGLSDASINQFIFENSPDRIIRTLTLSLTPTVDSIVNKYSRNQLVNDLSAILQSYNNSTITRTLVTDSNQKGYNQTYFNIHINQDNILNIPNIKYLLVFPEETDTDTPESRIWCPSGTLPCCFQFKNRVNNISDIKAETDSPQSNYVIVSQPYIQLTCIREGYVREENNYRIVVPSTNLTPTKNYTFEEYLNAINTSIASLNTANNNNLFNTTNTKVISDATTNNLVRFQFDIAKKFNTSQYNFIFHEDDLIYGTFDSYLHSALGIDFDTNTRTFTSTQTDFRSTYAIPFNNNILVKIRPIQSIYNHNDMASDFIVYATDYQAKTRQQFIGYINSVFQTFNDYEGSAPLEGVVFNIAVVNEKINATINIPVNKILSESDYSISFVDPSSNGIWGINNSWYNYLKIPDFSYNLADSHQSGLSYSIVTGSSVVLGYGANFSLNQQLTIKAVGNGVASTSNTNDIVINIPAASYTRTELLNEMNRQLSLRDETKDSEFVVETVIETYPFITQKQYIVFRANINKIYTAKDYRIVNYDNESFLNCNGVGSARQTSWNSTIGYMLGFTEKTEYDLFEETNTITYKTNNIVEIVGDSVVETFIYRNFMIILEDYNQSRINDGLVTSTPQQNRISYNSRPSKNPDLICDPITKLPLYQGQNTPTAVKTYAENKKLESNLIALKNTQNIPYIKDLFGVIPLNPEKPTIVEFGGTLQNQERVYFGPVNLRRLSIKLIDDRGELVDLNGSNWSFAFICEQLYSATSKT
jgi:hypothetical protein